MNCKTFVGKEGYLHISESYGRYPALTYCHRIIFEEYHKLTILPKVHVHHKDGNKLNNSIDNLELLSARDHLRMHKCGENNSFYGKKRPEHSKKMKGENNPFYGKTHSEKTRRIIAESNSRRGMPKEVRNKISKTLKGRKPWNAGKSKIDKHGGIAFLRLNKALGKTVLDITRWLGYANDGAIYGYLSTRNLKWSDL